MLYIVYSFFSVSFFFTNTNIMCSLHQWSALVLFFFCLSCPLLFGQHVQVWTLGWSRVVLWSYCLIMSTWTTGTCTHTVCTAGCERWMWWFIRMCLLKRIETALYCCSGIWFMVADWRRGPVLHQQKGRLLYGTWCLARFCDLHV